jgi:hypothetical protein
VTARSLWPSGWPHLDSGEGSNTSSGYIPEAAREELDASPWIEGIRVLLDQIEQLPTGASFTEPAESVAHRQAQAMDLIIQSHALALRYLVEAIEAGQR